MTYTKPSISHLCVLFCPCVVQKATAHVGTKALNMCHQAQKDFCGIFVGIPQYKKGYLVYVPHRQKIKYSYNVFSGDILSSSLKYMSQLYAEAITMSPTVLYITYTTSSRGKQVI